MKINIPNYIEIQNWAKQNNIKQGKLVSEIFAQERDFAITKNDQIMAVFHDENNCLAYLYGLYILDMLQSDTKIWKLNP